MGAISTIGNILPILSGAASVIHTFESTMSALHGISQGDSQKVQQDLAMKQLKEQQKLQERQLAQQSDLQHQQLGLQSAQADEDRRQALRRAVARQRAQFGASGIGGGSGSSDAVLLGLFDESDDERAKRENLDTLRSRALDLDIAQNRSINLLQATQLAQRQKLASLF